MHYKVYLFLNSKILVFIYNYHSSKMIQRNSIKITWFSMELPSSSTDDIEVRICGNEGTDNEDTPIELMEIYIQ